MDNRYTLSAAGEGMVYTNTGDLFDDYRYPATTADLIERYGDDEITLPEGTQRIGEILSLTDETFQSAEEARYAIYAGLSSRAIGRKGYTDRDPTPPGTDGPDPVSF